MVCVGVLNMMGEKFHFNRQMLAWPPHRLKAAIICVYHDGPSETKYLPGQTAREILFEK
jgi:hypothetical protein